MSTYRISCAVGDFGNSNVKLFLGDGQVQMISSNLVFIPYGQDMNLSGQGYGVEYLEGPLSETGLTKWVIGDDCKRQEGAEVSTYNSIKSEQGPYFLMGLIPIFEQKEIDLVIERLVICHDTPSSAVKLQNLRGRHVLKKFQGASSAFITLTIQSVEIVQEGLGAYRYGLSLGLKDNGNYVIDIGGRTCILLAVSSGGVIDHKEVRHELGITWAARQIAKNGFLQKEVGGPLDEEVILEAVKAAHNQDLLNQIWNSELPDSEYENLFVYGRTDVNFFPVFKEVMYPYVRAIFDLSRAVLREKIKSSMPNKILSGGGANIARQIYRYYKKDLTEIFFIPPDPVFANVKGFAQPSKATEQLAARRRGR